MEVNIISFMSGVLFLGLAFFLPRIKEVTFNDILFAVGLILLALSYS